MANLRELLGSGPSTISPTAHYTGYVWARNGLGPQQLATREGRVMHAAMQPLNLLAGVIGFPTFEGMLLGRHRQIDQVLTAEIESGRIRQVVEIAAGLSPRGYRITQRYDADQVTYLEADLPGMIERKKQALSGLPTVGHHHLAEVDATQIGGPGSLEDLVADLDPSQGLAVITEGLVNYLPTPVLTGLWARLAGLLSGFENGLYLSDLVLRDGVPGRIGQVAAGALGTAVRSGIHLHFANENEAHSALLEAGFDGAILRHPEALVSEELRGSARIARVVEAVAPSRPRLTPGEQRDANR